MESEILLQVQNACKVYDAERLFNPVTFEVKSGERIALIGPNGGGKSTILKMIAGVLKPDAGEIEIGETIKIGYFAQEEQEMDPSQRVIDYVKDIAEYITTREGKISASALLERFLFTPDMQYAPIGKLSGGEKRRLHLLGVLAENANVLLFDEAGNNLDIPTLTILEDYLNSFSGIVITVSHDRYFLDNIVDRIFELDGKGHIRQFEGGYTDYLNVKKRESASTQFTDKTENSRGNLPKDPAESNPKSWKQNAPQKVKFSYKEQREFETIDDDIAALEERIEKIKMQINANATNSVKLKELFEEQEKVQAQLDEKTERWVYLNEIAEKIGCV